MRNSKYRAGGSLLVATVSNSQLSSVLGVVVRESGRDRAGPGEGRKISVLGMGGPWLE